MKVRPIWMVLAIAIVLAAAIMTWRLEGKIPNPSSGNPAPATSQLVEHAQGTTAIPLHPHRVLVMDINALDTLDALGIEAMGVAGSDFPAHLLKYADTGKYLNMGTLFEPDYEAIHAAQPDLIITGGRSSAKYEPLSRMAPTLDMPTDNAHPVQTTLANLRMLGKIFDREEAAEAIARQIEAAIVTVRTRTAERGTGLIVLVSGGRLSAYGPGSRFGALHTDFGVPPAAPGLHISLHGEAISSEFILKTNPDWLFVIDRDVAIGEAGAAHQVLDNPLVHQTKAWKNHQVMYLDSTNWYLVGEGAQALQAMIEQVDQGYRDAPQQPR